MSTKRRTPGLIERRNRIRAIAAASQGTVRTSDFLAALPGVSAALLATDLSALVGEQAALVKVRHGVYAANRPRRRMTPLGIPMLAGSLYAARSDARGREKEAIARYVARTFLSSDGTFALDAGTTTTVVVEELVSFRPPAAVRIITNNLHAALLVSPGDDVDLHIAGGAVVHQYAATSGSIDSVTDAMLKATDVAVVGFSRITTVGFWTADREQHDWKRRLCGARRVVLVGTLDKIGRTFDGPPVHALDGRCTVVTDSNCRGIASERRKEVEAEIARFRKAAQEGKARLVLVGADGSATEANEPSEW